MFLALALLILIIWFFVWIYAQFIQTNVLKIAIPDRDAQTLRDRVRDDQRVQFDPIIVSGSREAAKLVDHGEVDLAFVQGGLEISQRLPRLETPNPEVILWFVRADHVDLGKIRRVLTSLNGEGSHSVAQAFAKAWHLGDKIEFVHEWNRLTSEEDTTPPADVDAVFVVKDPADPQTLRAAEQLARSGFHLASPDLGARANQLKYLRPWTIPKGYLQSTPPFPPEPVNTYNVTTYLVFRDGLSLHMQAAASRLLEGPSVALPAGRYEPTLGETSDLLQGVEAFLGIIINIVLAFLALTGLEMLAYRKRFHELNSLVSLISIHQSSKDVLGVHDPQRRHDHLLYLSLCSDLLGLVSMIGGYYTQENSSLLFSGLPEIIHQRCDGLKINIQLKILHATIDSDELEPDSAKPLVTVVSTINIDPEASKKLTEDLS